MILKDNKTNEKEQSVLTEYQETVIENYHPDEELMISVGTSLKCCLITSDRNTIYISNLYIGENKLRISGISTINVGRIFF